MKVRFLVSIVATVAVLIVSFVYLTFGVLKLNVVSDQTTVTITAPKSNGLHAGSAVLLRGVPIGDVKSVSYSGENDIEIEIAYDAGYAIPADTKLVIENQSMLGESGVFLTPEPGDNGPTITSGQRLVAAVVEVPASVPELLGSTQTLLDQVDPTLVNSLVETISTALSGLEEPVERLTPAAQLLAATMIYSQPALVKIIGSSTTMLQNGEWVGSSLRATEPELIYAGEALRDVITQVKPFADFTNGGQLIRERWKPTLDRAAVLSSKTVPAIGSIAEVLVPAAQRSGSLLGTLNISTLIEQAMPALPGDSLRLNVKLPN
ncbi:MlaD family protein [Williamsia sp.]|uniref:MlaD family protein n=1 Tax=Williamsia sp. TaxID=1872085 RepID=UPI002F94462F